MFEKLFNRGEGDEGDDNKALPTKACKPLDKYGI